MRRVAGRIVAGLVLIPFAYATAGLVGGAIPANSGWQQPATGIRIYVESNGVHTGIIVPKLAAGIDWRPYAPARDLADPRYAAYDHVAFGWGEKTFYLETPTWADVRIPTVAAAAVGSDRTLMHVDHLPEPRSADDVRAITLTSEQYRRLATFVAASFKPGGKHYRGYGPYDAFYDGTGRYSAVETCNAWTGDALQYAGVRVGRWTPFPVTVTGWF